MKPLDDFIPFAPLHQRINARLKLSDSEAMPSIPGLDTFSVYELKGNGTVSRSFSHMITFVADRDFDIETLCDTEAELILSDEQRTTVKKSIFGRIFRAEEAGSVARRRLYTITLVSPLYYLEFNRRYEVYMDKSVPEIVSEIIGRYDALLHLSLLNKTDPVRFPKRHYTTQYAQSDFDFITMLCEEEGLSLLVDPYSHDPYTLTLCELNEHAPVLNERIGCTFNRSKRFNASAQVQDYFDTYRPSVDFTTETGTAMSGGTMEDNASTQELRTALKRQSLRDRIETYDGALQKDLNRYKSIDAQRDFAPSLRITGKSGDLDLFEGCCVTLYDPKVHKEVEAIVLKVKYTGKFPNALDEYREESKDQPQYIAEFEAIPRSLIYRPESTLSKPRIRSSVTAIVSGGDQDTPSHANEIDVNEFGEIRVIFHFDEKRPTSCYIPLSTAWAGDGYGTQFLPRVNAEVIVSFVNGDPDRPIIIGTLHNGENRHPYTLPKEKTKSFIKTQTTPQYADEEGYNELLFEDKQGEELLSMRAQKDHSLHVLNDSTTHIGHDARTVIDHDMHHTVANDRTETVGNDYRLNVTGNKITTVEKEELTTVKEDRETHLLSNDTEVVQVDRKIIIEQNLIERIKGEATRYVELDQKEKALSNLFTVIGKEYGLRVTGAYHVTANSIKAKAGSTIELDAPSGISLKCGGTVLTVDASGIHLKGLVDTASSNGGVSATDVTLPEIEKPLYNKLRVTALEASVAKQSDIAETLTYTATVEKYENGAWAETTDLTPTQKAQLQWYFIKNNDDTNTDIITDAATDDDVSIDGLIMTVTLDPENIHRFGHGHCFVADVDEENGHALTELKRALDVVNVRGRNVIEPDATEADYRVFLNLEDATAEEIASLQVKIVETNADESQSEKSGTVEPDLTIKHLLEAEHTITQIDITVYPEGKEENYAKAITYCRALEGEEVVNARPDNQDDTYIGGIGDETYMARADTSLKDGTEVTVELDAVGKDGSVLASTQEKTTVSGQKIEQPFDITKLIDDNGLDRGEVAKFKGRILWPRK